ncbi:MAG: hypothetical protein FGM54_01550 [Chitinophagaceae bacterium]|nr:hypothetical protein [Chitinophagaceae bacterium]
MNCITCGMHFALRCFIIAGINCLYSCKLVYNTVSHQATRLSIQTNVPDTGAISRLIQPYRDSVNSMMDIPLAQTPKPLTKEKGGGSLGNFFSDAMLQTARERDPRVTLFITNAGGLRVNRWPEGQIMVRNGYELMPFDNALVILDVPGSIFNQWIQQMAKQGGWPIAGAFIKADTLNKLSYIAHSADGPFQAIDLQKNYRIATSDFIAKGGDRCDFLIPLPMQNEGILLREALLTYLKKNPRIEPNFQTRFIIQ